MREAAVQHHNHHRVGHWLASHAMPTWPLLILAIIACLHVILMLRAPMPWMPLAIRVALAPGHHLTLGDNELAAARAGARQLTLSRDLSGHWHIANVQGAGGNLIVQADGSAVPLGRSVLRPGLTWQVGATTFRATGLKARELEFFDGSRRWHYDGATVRADGKALPSCPGDSLRARWRAGWNQLVPHMFSVAQPLQFGGNLHCGMRIGSADMPLQSAVLRRHDAGFMLDVRAGLATPVLINTGTGPQDSVPRPIAVDGSETLVVAGTRYAMSSLGDELVLRPSGRVQLYGEPRTVLPDGVSWTWTQQTWWQPGGSRLWLLAAAGVLAGIGIVLRLLRARMAGRARRTGRPAAWPRQGRWGFSAVSALFARTRATAAPFTGAHQPDRPGSSTQGMPGALLALAGVAVLVTQKLGAPLGVGPSLLLGWLALMVWMGDPRRTGAWQAVGAVLLALGLLLQLELALFGLDATAPRQLQRTTALLAIGLGLARMVPATALTPASRSGIERLLMGGALLALAGIAMQVLLGDETGVFDIQPVEFAKAALVALAAHCMAIGLGWNSARQAGHSTARGMTARPGEPEWRRILRLAAPLALFLALFALGLMQVDDYSPLLLLLCWSSVMLLTWTLASARWRSAAILAIALLAVALGVAWLRSSALPLNQLDFYGDRFQVWLAPAEHPHTGQQWLQGARAIAAGGWAGHDGLFGMVHGPAPHALGIPAVADDFAPSMFIHRHGLAGALLLWGCQAAFLILAVLRALALLGAAASVRDFRRAWLARFAAFCLLGGAAFVAGHLLLSWGTNLAILPVMGQPMSFLSAGGSHLLFFLCPLLWIGSIPLPQPAPQAGLAAH